MNPTARYWLRMTALNAAAAAFVAVAFNGVTWQTPWRRTLEVLTVGFVFASTIGPICAIVIPRIAHAARCRVRSAAIVWALLIPAMIVIGTAGSLVAILILRVVGYIPTNDLVVVWFVGGLKITIIVTLLFGIFGTAVETLVARLNETTVALRTKERDEADARRLAAEAQLASLESRVNPHFLFNTLNSIAALVHDNPAAAERMTAQLAALMRSSLDHQSPLVTLDEELRVARTYLDIEQVRFGARLRFDFDADAEARRILVPRLSVQTLVENSVKYAVSPRRDGASIAVQAAQTDGLLRVIVEDDGPGFAPSAIADGHGIALLKSRLQMAFGGRAALDVDSKPGRTTITMTVPSGTGNTTVGAS